MTIVLSKLRHSSFIREILPDAKVVETLASNCKGKCLIGFGAGEIVPPELLAQFGRSYNFHGASPEYPGRDPHHWAAYDGAPEFGATAHAMTERVDEGFVVGTLTAGVPKDSGPEIYRQIGEDCLKALFIALAQRMASSGVPAIHQKWTGQKRSRADLIAKCDMRGLKEFPLEHRQMAFAGFEKHFIK